MTTLLVDADVTAFRAAAAAQTSIQWDDDIVTTHADLNEAKDLFHAEIKKYREAVDVTADIILCFSCPSRHYFRHDLLPTYKGNRKGTPPLVLRTLKEWAAENYEAKTKPNLEADDVLGILATNSKLVKGEKVIVSVDKDLKQIPGLHLNAGAPEEGVYRVAREYADRQLWLQALTGDAADNYTGLPGIGPVKAERILAGLPDSRTYAEAVGNAYLKAGLSLDYMAIQVNVARLLTTPTYDFKKGTPILWQP